MTTRHDLDIIQITDPGDVDPAIREEMTECWITVTNAGGAAGFPFPPVDAGQVAPAVDALAACLEPRRARILLARVNGALAGWVVINGNLNPVAAHWGTVNHLQTHPAYRGRGIGSALMHRLRQVARDEMGLEQLHLEARSGMGLEDFYTRLGWKEIGRWPGALRIAPDDSRDEILMVLTPL